MCGDVAENSAENSAEDKADESPRLGRLQRQFPRGFTLEERARRLDKRGRRSA